MLAGYWLTNRTKLNKVYNNQMSIFDVRISQYIGDWDQVFTSLRFQAERGQ